MNTTNQIYAIDVFITTTELNNEKSILLVYATNPELAQKQDSYLSTNTSNAKFAVITFFIHKYAKQSGKMQEKQQVSLARMKIGL